MNKVAISAVIGVAAGGAVAGAYYGAPYAGVSVSPSLLMALAAILAFGSSTAAFALVALNKAPEKKKIARSSRFNDLPATQFIQPLCEDGALQIVMRPDSTVETLDIFKHPSSYTDKPILVTIKKSSEKRVFNPIVLKQLFIALKPFGKFLHLLLVNEHDEFIGYIPAWRARLDFVGPNGESQIRKYIIDVLTDPAANGGVVRDIGGLATEDWIDDNDTVAQAVEKSWDGLVRGLVICKSKRNRKPIGIIFKEDLYKLAAYGA